MGNPFVILGKDGKPTFIGAEDKNNPPVRPPTVDPLICPQCQSEVDHLLGNTKKGCEACYKESEDKPEEDSNESYDKSKQVI